MKADLECVQHLARKACALGVAGRRDCHREGGGQQLSMLGDQGPQAHAVLGCPAWAILGSLRGPTKGQQWLQLPACTSVLI